LQEGRAQGLQEGILTLLRTLYGAVPAEVEAQLRAIRDVATLNALYPLAVSAGSLENFAQQLAQRQRRLTTRKGLQLPLRVGYT
jgi:hypothetical protein